MCKVLCVRIRHLNRLRSWFSYTDFSFTKSHCALLCLDSLIKPLKKTFLSKYTMAAIVLAIVFIAGIFTKSKVFAPDLHRLYMESMMVQGQPPVIFIHGVLGSKLNDVDTQQELWPGGFKRLLLNDYAEKHSCHWRMRLTLQKMLPSLLVGLRRTYFMACMSKAIFIM
ncbi:MAG: hypothetical protein ACI8PW_001676 [Methylophilaceae bacterium]|jgi:hypothetical protein